MQVVDLGIISFSSAFALQERILLEVAEGSSAETLLLLEHLPVYTTGNGGDLRHVLTEGVEIVRTNRGGDVTYHGPGQLVGYPLVRLDRRGRDLHRYLRFLEEVIISTAADFKVGSWREPGMTGVWTSGGKIASIGVGVRRWVTLHGFAINVGIDTAPFKHINPCGIPGCPVTTLEIEGGRPVTVTAVKETIAKKFFDLMREELPVVT